jgi:hypothetical protein
MSPTLDRSDAELKSEKGNRFSQYKICVVTEQEIRDELGSLFDIVELREFRFWTNQLGYRPLAWSILMRGK